MEQLPDSFISDPIIVNSLKSYDLAKFKQQIKFHKHLISKSTEVLHPGAFYKVNS